MARAPKPGVGYPQNVVTFARRLHEKGELSITEIRHRLGRRGYTPAHSTVLAWLDPYWAEGRRERQRKGGKPGPDRACLPWLNRLERIHELRKAGVSYASIARVMNLDFGLSLTDDLVRLLLNGSTPKTQRKHLYPEAA